jgi:hypothetical protein
MRYFRQLFARRRSLKPRDACAKAFDDIIAKQEHRLRAIEASVAHKDIRLDRLEDRLASSVPSPTKGLNFISRPAELLAAFTLAAAALYTFIWATYEQYYFAIGLNGDDVGLSYVTVLSRAALSLGIIIAMVFAGLFLASADYTTSRLKTRIEGGTVIKNVAIAVHGPVLAVIVRGIAVLAIPRLLTGNGGSLDGVFIVAALLLTPAVLLLAYRGVAALTPMENSPTLRFVLTVIMSGASLVLLFAAFYVGPQAIGSRAARELQSAEFTITTRLGLQVVPVVATWTSGSTPTGMAETGLYYYLGRANEVTILYDPSSKLVLRIPSQNIVLRTPVVV